MLHYTSPNGVAQHIDSGSETIPMDKEQLELMLLNKREVLWTN